MADIYEKMKELNITLPAPPPKGGIYTPVMEFGDHLLYCSGCGICELYACPQSLSPRSLITEYRERLREKGIKVPAKEEMPANDSSFEEHQSVRGDQIISALGLGKYDGKVPAELMAVEMQR